MKTYNMTQEAFKKLHGIPDNEKIFDGHIRVTDSFVIIETFP